MMGMCQNFTIYFLLIVLCPIVGLLLNFLSQNSSLGSRFATRSIFLGFMTTVVAWIAQLPFSQKDVCFGFLANEISWLMATLILFISAIVHQFSISYLAGDKNYRTYFLCLTMVTISTLLMAASDNIILLVLFWTVSNQILVVLMIHKAQWAPAKNAGMVASKTFAYGLIFLLAGIGVLAYESETLSLASIVENSHALSCSARVISLTFIILAASTQSGAWPFHRWLISSLNSPTPVSSLMHAGLVNGGGVLLARFAPVFFQEDTLLQVLFVLGLATLILGGIWKLLQSDIKRMLACSTVTQMGFMFMQCGLGLFPAAFAHICWHGLFKAFLFLRSGSTITENGRANDKSERNLLAFFLACLCGVLGAFGFAKGNRLSLTIVDANTVLIFFSWMASAQIANSLLQKYKSPFFIFGASIMCWALGYLYGVSVDLLENALESMHIAQVQPLNIVHVIAMCLLFCIWVLVNIKPFAHREGSVWWRRFYVSMLNASQPNAQTITSTRSLYKF